MQIRSIIGGYIKWPSVISTFLGNPSKEYLKRFPQNPDQNLPDKLLDH